MNNIVSKYFQVKNAEMIFSMTYQYIKDKFNYEIGIRGENDLLMEIMEHIAEKYPNISLKDMNKHTIDMFIEIIVKKIVEAQQQREPQREPQIQSSNLHIQERPQYNIQPENISNSIEYEQQQRNIAETIPDRVSFTIPLNENNNINVNDEFTKLLQEREILPTIEADLSKTSGHDVLQDEPKNLTKFKKERKDNITRDHYIVIDSRDRNHDDYDNPNSYRVNLEQPLYNVLSMELISAEIPASQYLINSSNNLLEFQETNAQVSADTYFVAQIPYGNYTISELKTAIESALNTASTTGANFTVDISTLASQKKLTISSDIGGGADIFNILLSGGIENYGDKTRTLYRENTIGSLLGFNRENKTGSSSYSSDFQYNLHGDTYILLKFDDIKNIEGIANNVQDAFTKITLDTHTDDIKYFKNSTDYKILKYMEKPISRIDHFHVSFLTYNQNLYDFNGLEHSFTLKVTTLDHKF